MVCLSSLACGVYQRRNLWVYVSGRHSTESSCEVNKWVIHLCICAHSCLPYSCVPHRILRLTKLYFVSAVELPAAAQTSTLCILHQISVSSTRPSVKKQTLKRKLVPLKWVRGGRDAPWHWNALRSLCWSACLNAASWVRCVNVFVHWCVSSQS